MSEYGDCHLASMPIPTGFNLDLAKEFFVYFARFEYAMKMVGYLKPKEAIAKANWKKLEKELKNKFEHPSNGEFQKALDYYKTKPPEKLMVKDGSLGWEKDEGSFSSDSERVLEYVRSVRNNLFHGGKFKDKELVPPNSKRSDELMIYGIIILNECLKVLDNLREAYER